MATSGSTEQRPAFQPSNHGSASSANGRSKPGRQKGSDRTASDAPFGNIPIVVFLGVAFALWAIGAMMFGQTVGRLVATPFPVVSILAALFAGVVLAHAKRNGLRIVVTIGDGVSTLITMILAFAARGLVNWPFLSPLTVADDAARHFGMVNWIAKRQAFPNAPTPDLLQFAEYPMSAHYLAATIARTFGLIPLRVANILALGLTYGLWILLGSAAAFAWQRSRPHAPQWQRGLAAATVPLVGYATSTLTLWAVTASYFYAQVVGLWFAGVVTALVLTNPCAMLGSSSKKRAVTGTLPRWWPLLVSLMVGPSLVYPLHLLLTAAVVTVVVVVERRLTAAVCIAVGMAVIGLAVQLPWLGAATKMSQEEGSILQPTLADLGGFTVWVLVVVGVVFAWRTKSETIGALSVLLGAAQVGALALAYAAGVVSKYTSIKVISSVLPGLLVVAAFGAVSLGEAVAEFFSADRSRVHGEGRALTVPNASEGNAKTAFDQRLKRAFAPAIAAGTVCLSLVQAIRFPPLTGLTRPLVSADGYRVARWASTHVDPNDVGIVAPGIEAYSLWWTALDRKKDLTVLRKMQPASMLWSEWPSNSAERYLIVVTKGQAKSFAARNGVRVLFRSGNAVLLERSK